jgi:SAM-dependent methyltransferase
MLPAGPGDLVGAAPEVFAEDEWTPVESCPLCDSEASLHRPFAAQVMGVQTLSYKLCARCGLAFQSPRLTPSALERHYRLEYRLRSHSRESDPRKDRWVQERRAEHLAAAVRRLHPGVKRHLDVGSSTGALLVAIGRAFGSEGLGVEPGEADRSEVAQAGFQVVASIEQLPPQALGSFDLITLSHVLEHLPDPVGTLRELRARWLVADGLLLIETPNLFSHPSFELVHLTAFSAATLRGALAVAGLETVELRRHGKPYSRWLPLFLLAAARPAPSSSSVQLARPRPGWIRLRRLLGLGLLRAARLAARVLLGGRRLQPWAE